MTTPLRPSATSPGSATLAHRAALHAALGDPTRLGIVDELMLSDRSPSELAERFDLPTNLLAHHLGLLERVGLVERIVSAGDRRRRYVRLVPDTVQALRAGHPTTAAGRVDGRARALFVCTHNSARSQLAAAIWRRRTGAPARSAGTHPAATVHPGAVAAAARRGLDLGRARPRRLSPGELHRAEVVVTVCDRAHEEVELPGSLHWSIPDPVAADDPDAFDRAAEVLDQRISALSASTLISKETPA